MLDEEDSEMESPEEGGAAFVPESMSLPEFGRSTPGRRSKTVAMKVMAEAMEKDKAANVSHFKIINFCYHVLRIE